MRRMPPDGLCLYHAVNYAQNPELYEKVDIGTNAMPLGEGSGTLFQAAATLRGKLIATLISEGRHEQARRLSNPGAVGYAEEEDFPTLARIASLSFEIVIESAPHMQPRKYGDGDPRARFILRDILDIEGHRSSHWDVAELYDRKKRRRITGKTSAICEPHSQPAASDILGTQILDGISTAAKCEPVSTSAAASSSAERPGVSVDIIGMENTVGQYIRDNGNPNERELYPMLQKMGHPYSRTQIRLWKRQYGEGSPDQTPITTETTSSHAIAEVPDDILVMENTVGSLIRAKGNPNEQQLYSMLKAEGHRYTRNQVRLWKLHCAGAASAPEKQIHIDSETAVRDHHEDITFCVNLGEGYRRLMSRLLAKGFSLPEYQARLALVLVKYAELPAATSQQWEDFADILAKGMSQEAAICQIAEQRGWMVSLRTMRSMRSAYEQQMPLAELNRRYGEALKQRFTLMGNSYGGGFTGLQAWLTRAYSVTCSNRTMRTWLDKQGDVDSCVSKLIDIFEQDPSITPGKVLEQLDHPIVRSAVTAWLRHARLCHSFRGGHLRPTWYLSPTAEMLNRLSAIINDGMNETAAMQAAATAGIFFGTHELFKDCKERAVIIHAWSQESQLSFALKAHGIAPKGKPIEPEQSSYDFWCQFCSWSFCRYCHRRRPEGPPALHDIELIRKAVVYKCNHATCSLDADLLSDRKVRQWEERDGFLHSTHSTKYETSALYVTPKHLDWPCYADGKYELGAEGESMTELTQEEARSLELVLIWCDMKQERGRTRNLGTYNWKKMGISRGKWKEPSMTTRHLTTKARAAYDWLMQHNTTYAAWQQKHEAAMAAGPHKDYGYVFQTWNLLLHSPGIEVASFPVLYPQSSYGDTDARERLMKLDWIAPNAKTSIGFSYMKKLTSPCLSYAQDAKLMFLLHDIHMSKQIMTKLSMAEQKNITPDVMSSGMTNSESYWRHEQDVLADLVRIMDELCQAALDPDLKTYCAGDMQSEKNLAFPNLFITIAPGEWKTAMHMSTKPFADSQQLSEAQSILTLHLYHYLTSVVKKLLNSKFFKKCYHYVIRYEFQGRGTLHLHIAVWLLPDDARPIASLVGQSRKKWSPLIELLEKLCHASIDVQEGSGHLNYINGYTTKASDALNFCIKPYAAKKVDHKWLTTYRLLSKCTPLIPEVITSFGQLPHMKRSFHVGTVYPPVQHRRDEVMRKGLNSSDKLYAAYLAQMAQQDMATMSFLQFARVWQMDAAGKLTKRSSQCITAVGVRYRFELNDLFYGEFALMMMPHSTEDCFLAEDKAVLMYTDHYVGVLKFLMLLAGTEDGNVEGVRKYAASAFSTRLPAGQPGEKIFQSELQAHEYLKHCMVRDLEMRSIGNGRRRSFALRVEAVRMFTEFAASLEGHERESLQQDWNMRVSPLIQNRVWSDEQKQILQLIEDGIENTDPDRLDAERWLGIKGRPGSGKSEAMAHGAVTAAAKGAAVLLLCPTGALLCSYREKIPDNDRIDIETLHSAFVIRREADEVVQYAPPTRLRRYDLIMIDEASQIEDSVFMKMIVAVRELPQKPMVCIAADLKQLRPVGSGGMMASLLSKINTVELKTIYRSSDPAHLLFLNQIRDAQPSRALIGDYFAERHWEGDLRAAVRKGLDMQTSVSEAFMWLTVSNKGAARVNEEALHIMGVTETDRAVGCRADPKVSDCRIVPRAGILVRLTRNCDKQRGFVNGAIGEIVTVLSPNCFTVRLKTGTMVLVHPICGNKEVPFLPCTYGYATTIRRAQGMTLNRGCVFFDLAFPPDRGYAYVAVSRFRTRAGVYHFGRYRRSDWLPVGEAVEGEQTQRSYESMTSDSDEEHDSDEDASSDSVCEERSMWDHDADVSDDEEPNMFNVPEEEESQDLMQLYGF